MDKYFEELKNQDWNTLIRQTTYYALKRLKQASLLTGSTQFPIGSTPKDICFKAIASTFDGEKRKWNKELHPNILDHLTSVVNSLIYSHFKSFEKKSRINVNKQIQNDKEENIDFWANVTDGTNLIDSVEYNELESCCYKAVEDDEELSELLLLVQEGNSREHIALIKAVKLSDVDNMKKRLRRKLNKYLMERGFIDEPK